MQYAISFLCEAFIHWPHFIKYLQFMSTVHLWQQSGKGHRSHQIKTQRLPKFKNKHWISDPNYIDWRIKSKFKMSCRGGVSLRFCISIKIFRPTVNHFDILTVLSLLSLFGILSLFTYSVPAAGKVQRYYITTDSLRNNSCAIVLADCNIGR